MKKILFVLLAMVFVSSAAMADLNQQKLEKDLDAMDPGEQTRQLLDCSNAYVANCGDFFTGNNGNGVNNVELYSCVSYTESGPEEVYEIVLTETTLLGITMVPAGCDLDLFLLGSCDEGDCLDYSGTVSEEYIEANLAAGTYYVVVDGYSGAICDYTIEFTCEGGSEPPPNPTCETALELECGTVDLLANTCDGGNNYDPLSGGCTGFSATGDDIVWHMIIPDGGSVDLLVNEIDHDASAYIVTDCDDVPGSCLVGMDCFPQPCSDTLFYTNTSGADMDAYLIMDGYGGSCGDLQITGTLDCDEPTATEKTTWGKVKSLHR
ncbi:MAG: hypothetical protein GF355_16315 [Candidatus Eisenbacteria bacterium]|nr:hypothetical protein [Candidatus Eisenbacteria bacterium]